MHMVLVCRSAHYTKATFLSILTGAPSQCVSSVGSKRSPRSETILSRIARRPRHPLKLGCLPSLKRVHTPEGGGRGRGRGEGGEGEESEEPGWELQGKRAPNPNPNPNRKPRASGHLVAQS
jgi:hypothetical protein